MATESRIGLDYIVDNPDYTQKLASALDTTNVIVKKQVFELLSALAVYNADGYTRALDTLDHYKNLRGRRYRLEILVTELQAATAVDYKTALLAFINCLIISTPQLQDRIRMRNEFIGLKLLPVLSELRKTAGTVADLAVQLDVFEEHRDSDEAHFLQGTHSVDLSSHLDVFYAILRQVADTPQEIPFLSILQHLLSIDPREAVSDIVWDTAETLVHRATLLEHRKDASRLLRSPSVQGKLFSHCTCHPHRDKESAASGRKPSLSSIPAATSVPPPPPPPPSAPPPPPLQIVPPPPPPVGALGPPPCPPPPSADPALNGVGGRVTGLNVVGGPGRSVSPERPDASAPLLPQQETPTPKTKMKTINWNKIPNNKVVGKHNIWSLVARCHQHSPVADLDWNEMEGLFCLQGPAPTTSSPPSRSSRESTDADRRRKESSEIVLLDGKRSLNVNIFLKQFRSCNDDIIGLIREGAHDEIGAEKLRGLLKLLPELDEVEMLQAFDGDPSKLGNAEKFLLQLIKVPNYKLRIESMLLKEEFATNMGYLEPSINAMIVAGEDLMTNKPLQEVLYMVIRAGNFLNSGGYAGNAAGVKLSSLQKLTDIRANKPGMHLIHYVALQAEKKNKNLLSFPDDLTVLEDATKSTVEQIKNEINTLDGRIKKIKQQVDLASTDNDIKQQMAEFLQVAEQEVRSLHKDMEDLEGVRRSLAEFFCEDVASFKLEECLRTFHGFCSKFRQAVLENERRRIQEEQANARRRQREEQLAARRRHLSAQMGSIDSDCQLVDNLLYDIRSGFPQKKGSDRDVKVRSLVSEEEASIPGSPLLSRRRLGSFSGQSPEQLAGSARDENSPDVTPTGSLRRRRSRVLSEEDDNNLMDFLRSSGNDVSRERKSWGSLDRSWARRARGGSGRRRPELLSADFGEDRERPASPTPPLASPATPTPPLATPEQDDTRPKAWRQKIEAWLQGNEKEGRESEELRRRARRLQNNRKSLEGDSESERSGGLDTLVEGSSVPQQGLNSNSPTQYQRVYPDWRPAIDKADVVGTMEAIAGAESPVKDKSSWRKSNLNVPNTSEETDLDARRLRRMRSRNSMESGSSSSMLQAIKEEERRKCSPVGSVDADKKPDLDQGLELPFLGSQISSAPSSPLLSRVSLRPTTLDDDLALPPSVPRRLRRPPPAGSSTPSRSSPSSRGSPPSRGSPDGEPVSDRIEIDSDNIETPPATRRVFGTATSSSTPSRLPDEEEMGDGQFERFSSARRTRRYKKSQDDSESENFLEKQPPARPTSLQTSPASPPDEPKQNVWHNEADVRAEDSDGVTREALADITKSSRELQNLEQTALRPKHSRERDRDRERARSYIDPSHIAEASRGRNITPTVPRVAKGPSACSQYMQHGVPAVHVSSAALNRPRNEFIPEIRIHASAPAPIAPKLRPEHDFADEGFEETQSLMSETPSQGTGSSDVVDSPARQKQSGAETTDSSLGSVESKEDIKPASPVTKTNVTVVTVNATKPTNQTNTQNTGTRTLQRARSQTERPAVRAGFGSRADTGRSGPSILTNRNNETRSRPRSAARAVSADRPVKKPSAFNGNPVERSNSRTSLRSSRSSLASATSVNTVRKMPPATVKTPTANRLAGYTNAIKNLTSNLRNGAGPHSNQKKAGTHLLKGSTGVSASRSSSSGSSIGPPAKSFNKENASRSSSNGSSVGVNGTGNAVTRRSPWNSGGASFMRPTAASVAKDAPPPKPRTSIRTGFK